MKKFYGLPYQGSKGKLADSLMKCFPSAQHFYDLFGGGGAMTECAVRSGKFKVVHYNDLQEIVVAYVKGALEGSFDTEQFIGREEYYHLRKTNPMVRFVYSTRNGGGSYCFSCKKLESTSEQDLFKNKTSSMNRIKNFSELANFDIRVTNKDYRKIPIAKDSVIYCDIPYRNTSGYKKSKGGTVDFDWDSFYDWCEQQSSLVFISEYQMPKNRFISVDWIIRTGFDPKERFKLDRLFIPKKQLSLFVEMLQRTKK